MNPMEAHAAQKAIRRERDKEKYKMTDLSERLAALSEAATPYDLSDSGRYFSDGGCYANLTQCHHGDTGEYSNRTDGKLVQALWNAYRQGQIITREQADAEKRDAVMSALDEVMTIIKYVRIAHEADASDDK